MKIPVLIFLISGIAASRLEPVTNHVAVAGHVKTLRGQLADAQLDMMRVLRSAHDSVEPLETHEAGLKYAIRAEQIRLAEKTQCQNGARC